MQITYAIEYARDASIYLEFIDSLLQKSDLEYGLEQREKRILISLDGTEELIKEFLAHLGAKLPLSLFMGSSSIEAFVGLEKGRFDKRLRPQLSLHQDDVVAILDSESPEYLNPFISPQFFGYEYKTVGAQHITLKIGDRLVESTNEEIFAHIVTLLQEGKNVEMETFFGRKIFSLGQRLTTPNPTVLLSSTKQVSLLFDLSEKEYIALCTIERPQLLARINHDFDTEGRFERERCAKVRLPFCSLEYMLAKFLKEAEIEYLFEMAYDSSIETSAKLSLQGVEYEEKSPLEVMVVDGESYILGGERGVALEMPQITQECADNVGAIYSVIIENDIFTEKLGALYLSKKSKQSSFCAYKDTLGVRKFIEFQPILPNINAIYERIAANKSGVKLVENFERRFKILEQGSFLRSYGELENLEQIFGLFGLFAGVEGKRVEEIFENLNANSLGYEDQRSVKIDMKIDKIDGKFSFNYYKTLQSIMSFRLADVGEEMLSYAIFESFADFVNDNLYEICKQNETTKAVICGDFFANKMLMKRVKKHSSNLYTIYRNITMPLDGINIKYGCGCAKTS